MLVYANHLVFEGEGAEAAVFKGVGGWLKKQLGFGLRPDQVKNEGEFNGYRGDTRSFLRIHATYEDEPALWSWVLRHSADAVRGRQWIVEVGVKKQGGLVEVSCVAKTDEHSTLVSAPVSASQPGVVPYIINNILASGNASFAGAVPGEPGVKSIGADRDSYRAFLAEIQRRDRNGAIVVVSPTREGEYLVNPEELQRLLIGLGQVVKVVPGANTYEMSDILGKQHSAWGGAVNVLSIPTVSGAVRYRFFLADDIREWGDDPRRLSQVLAWVTSNTNLPRLRDHVRPEGVMQLSARRRMQRVREHSAQMDVAQLRQALEEQAKQGSAQEKFFDELIGENAGLEAQVAKLKEDLEDANDDLRRREFDLSALKDQLSRAGGGRSQGLNAGPLLKLAAQKDDPSPLQCIEAIELVYRDRCIVLETARTSAGRVGQFVYGRDLLDMLTRLVTDYRDGLMDGGDSRARAIFGKNEYAAKESETVMSNKSMRRQRTFGYEGEDVEMFRHLKIGVDDDITRTIRVHFHWDADRQKIVIGYCGEHLPVATH